MAENFSDIGREEAIRRLYGISAYQAPEALAVEVRGAGAQVTSAARLYVEGVDFNLVYFPLKHLGYKSVVGVTGELYAALGHPRLLNVVLGISAKLDFDQVRDLWTGITVAAKEHGYESVALDLQPSPNGLYISLSATGETALLTRKRRPRPSSKDLLCVSGPLGAAYLGLQILEQGRKEFETKGVQPDLTPYRMIVGDYLRPELDASVVERLEEAEIYPSEGAFITRGLADAVKRMARRTGLGAKVYADKIPFEGNSFQAGKQLDIDPVSAAFNGGDDFRLLFTVPILQLEKFRRDFQTFDIIGHLALPEAGSVLVTPEGVELPLRAQGWAEKDSNTTT